METLSLYQQKVEEDLNGGTASLPCENKNKDLLSSNFSIRFSRETLL